jgi:acyl-CoA thioester hydrolase
MTATTDAPKASPTHVHPLRVYWEDTDASGVVYHANYLKWFERARTEWLRALGYSQDKLMTEVSIAFTVASIEILYRRPARLDDEVEVFTSIAELKNVSLTFSQVLRRLTKYWPRPAFVWPASTRKRSCRKGFRRSDGESATL